MNNWIQATIGLGIGCITFMILWAIEMFKNKDLLKKLEDKE